MNAHLQPTGSAYFIASETEKPETHTLSVLVDNEPGVLARVIGLFSGRGYNIESLTVSETEHEKHLSRITIVTRGTPHVLEQIKHQLERIVPVHRVVDLSVRAAELGQERPLERELALVKVTGTGDHRGSRPCALRRRFGPHVIDANTEHFIFEITGKVAKIEQFIAIMKPLGLVEVCRTGVAAMNRGPQGMSGHRLVAPYVHGSLPGACRLRLRHLGHAGTEQFHAARLRRQFRLLSHHPAYSRHLGRLCRAALLRGLGLGALLSAYPALHTALKVAGAAYLLYLAWRIARSRSLGGGGDQSRPMSFLEAAAFQWVNPKAWVLAVTAMAVYTDPAQPFLSVAIVAIAFTLVNLPSVSSWAGFGMALRGFLADPVRLKWFNVAMGVLLAATLWPMLR